MFKDSFKYYKSKKDKPKLDKVIDLHSEIIINESEIKPICLHNKKTHFTLNPPETWKVFNFSSKTGLTYIRNPFSSIGQRYWTVRCLRDFSKKSNRRNLDSFNLIPYNQEWWDVAQKDESILNKMRWATLGYHHNWDTKVYTEDNKSEFPSDLADLSKVIAYNLGFEDFVSEAAIINYYHMDSTLSGHTDHSEKNLKAPLFSFSFGQTAIFLLGGYTIEEEPLSIFLRSGDIIVMSEESRLCYHGVPKILKTTDTSWNMRDFENIDVYEIDLIKNCRNEIFWKPYNDYLTSCRINMNVRQVLYKNQKKLDNT